MRLRFKRVAGGQVDSGAVKFPLKGLKAKAGAVVELQVHGGHIACLFVISVKGIKGLG